MKKTILFIALTLFTFGAANAQFGKKLKNKIKNKAKVSKPVEGSANDPNRVKPGTQAPLDEIWSPEVEPITDPSKITEAYLEKVVNIESWIGDRLSNDERRHIYNLFKRIGLIANRAINGMSIGDEGDWLEFQIKDMEVIRYEAINQGERPSVDGVYHHMEGFVTNWYCPQDIYDTPFHAELRKWFPAAKAIVEYDLKKRKGAKLAFVDGNATGKYKGKGNVIMAYDKDGNLVRAKNL